MPICPKCNKARDAREKVVKKRGKSWLIEFCRVCDYNFDINEWHRKTTQEIEENRVDTKKRSGRFRSFFSDRTRDTRDEDR